MRRKELSKFFDKSIQVSAQASMLLSVYKQHLRGVRANKIFVLVMHFFDHITLMEFVTVSYYQNSEHLLSYS